MSHHDVVDADEKWKYPPFEGVIEDECVWGRGAVDTKGSLCAFLEATESLLKEAVKKIDGACSKGVIKKNTASRKKSNLAKKLNKLA